MTSQTDETRGGGALFRVLQIEDDKQYAYLVREHLHLTRPNTFAVERTDRLADGLDQLGRGAFDLVLLDLDLPDSKGLDSLRGLVAVFPGVPVVVLTGHDDEDNAIEALREGAQDYLVKTRTEPGKVGRALLYAIQRHLARDATASLAREVQDGQARFLDLLEESEDGIVILDGGSQAVFVSGAAERIFGRPRSELLGAELGFLVPDGDQGEVDIVRPGSPSITANIRVTGTRWRGDAAQMVWLRDVSEHREVETIRARLQEEEAYSTQLEAVGQERSVKLQSVSERLTPPLTLLRNAVDLLDAGRLGKTTPQQRQIVDLMSRNLTRLEQYTADALKLSRLESGDHPLPVQELVLEWALRPVLALLTQRAEQAEMMLQLGDPGDLRVVACPDALTDVVSALVDHAIQRNEPGTNIALNYERSDSRSVAILVTDDGPGWEADELERLFEIPAASDPDPGHGLALAVCHSLVEKMGGSLDAHGYSTGGTTFRVSLPITPPTPVFGRVARSLGYVTDEDISQVCGVPVGRSKQRKRIGDLLVDHGMLNEEQRESTLAELSRRLSSPHRHIRGATLRDGLLGRRLLARGHVSQRQLDEALREQENRRTQGERHLLGRVLVESETIDLAQLEDALTSQGIQVMRCESCERRFNLLVSPGRTTAVCIRCGSATAPASDTQILDVDGEILPAP